MTPRERALRAESARLWLQYTLSEPMPAREVFKLAERDDAQNTLYQRTACVSLRWPPQQRAEFTLGLSYF
jgi:hypothetical protein